MGRRLSPRAGAAGRGTRRRARAAVALLLGLAAACVPPGAGAPAMDPPPVLPLDTGTFVLVQDGRAIGFERFQRDADSLHAELELLDDMTLVTDARLHPDASVGALEIRVYGPGGLAGEPLQSSAARFVLGTIQLEQPIGTPASAPIRAPDGIVPYMNPSPAWLEQVLRRARMMRGSPARVPVWVPGEPAAGVAWVEFRADTALIDLDDVLILADTDDAGRLLGAHVPDDGLEIRRR